MSFRRAVGRVVGRARVLRLLKPRRQGSQANAKVPPHWGQCSLSISNTRLSSHATPPVRPKGLPGQATEALWPKLPRITFFSFARAST